MPRCSQRTVLLIGLAVALVVLATHVISINRLREGLDGSGRDDGTDPSNWTAGVTGKVAQCQAAANYFGIHANTADWGCAPDKWRQDSLPGSGCQSSATSQWTGKEDCSWWSKTCSIDPSLPDPAATAQLAPDPASPQYKSGCTSPSCPAGVDPDNLRPAATACRGKSANSPCEFTGKSSGDGPSQITGTCRGGDGGSLCCMPRGCPLPPLGEGVVGGDKDPCPVGTGMDLASGQQCSVKCGEGYTCDKTAPSQASSSCQPDDARFSCVDGNLVNPNLACVKEGCTLPSSLGSNIVPGQTDPCSPSQKIDPGSSCNVQCAPGYQGDKGTTQYSCADGKLATPTLKCTPQGCGLPSSLGAGIIGGEKSPCAASQKLKSGETCSIQCDKGYKGGGGTDKYDCEQGKLGAATLKCSPITCAVPDHFGLGVAGVGHNACVVGATLKSGESCGVGCRDGYKSTGGTTSYQCAGAGGLSTASLKCERIACPLPTGFGKGKTWGGAAPCEEGGQLLAGQHCTIKCASGFQTAGGSPMYSCGTDGSMTDPSLRCTPNTCKLPQKFGAGKKSGGAKPCQSGGLLDSGGDCTIECAPGYKAVSGSADYSCDQGGHLKPPTLECQQVSCSIPGGFGPGVTGAGEKPCVPGSQLSAGATCSIACAPGYEVAGGEDVLGGDGGTADFSCSKAGFLTEPELTCRQDEVLAYNAVWAIDVGGIRN